MATAAGQLEADHKPDLTNTSPFENIGPFPSWKESNKIVSLDPWGANIYKDFKSELDQGYDIRPSIAVTKAHIHMPELK